MSGGTLSPKRTHDEVNVWVLCTQYFNLGKVILMLRIYLCYYISIYTIYIYVTLLYIIFMIAIKARL